METILVLITLFCKEKTIGEVWDPDRLVILVIKLLFCMQNPQMRAGPMETCNSDPKVAVLHVKATNEGWDP